MVRPRLILRLEKSMSRHISGQSQGMIPVVSEPVEQGVEGVFRHGAPLLLIPHRTLNVRDAERVAQERGVQVPPTCPYNPFQTPSCFRRRKLKVV